MAGMTYRTLTVEANGTLQSSTSLMKAETGDGVAWVVVNESAATVKVRTKDYKKKTNNAPLVPITFIKATCTVPPGGLPGIIVGQITFLPPGPPGSVVPFKYTIELKSTILNKDYDPDLEIKRP